MKRYRVGLLLLPLILTSSCTTDEECGSIEMANTNGIIAVSPEIASSLSITSADASWGFFQGCGDGSLSIAVSQTNPPPPTAGAQGLSLCIEDPESLQQTIALASLSPDLELQDGACRVVLDFDRPVTGVATFFGLCDREQEQEFALEIDGEIPAEYVCPGEDSVETSVTVVGGVLVVAP